MREHSKIAVAAVIRAAVGLGLSTAVNAASPIKESKPAIEAKPKAEITETKKTEKVETKRTAKSGTKKGAKKIAVKVERNKVEKKAETK